MKDEKNDLSRGKHNKISKKVFEVAKPCFSGDKEKIMRLIDGERCTKEIAVLMKKDTHKISGRFTWLKVDGFIVIDREKKFDGSLFGVPEFTEKGFKYCFDFLSQ